MGTDSRGVVGAVETAEAPRPVVVFVFRAKLKLTKQVAELHNGRLTAFAGRSTEHYPRTTRGEFGLFLGPRAIFVFTLSLFLCREIRELRT